MIAATSTPSEITPGATKPKALENIINDSNISIEECTIHETLKGSYDAMKRGEIILEDHLVRNPLFLN